MKKQIFGRLFFYFLWDRRKCLTFAHIIVQCAKEDYARIQDESQTCRCRPTAVREDGGGEHHHERHRPCFQERAADALYLLQEQGGHLLGCGRVAAGHPAGHHEARVRQAHYRNGTLRADFFRDIWKVEKARKRFDEKEVQLFKDVLREGMETGVFQIDDLDMTAELVHYCVKGIEVPYIRGQIGANLDDETRDKYVARIVFGALHRKDPKAL